MLKAYKYRLYPTKAQKELIEKHFGCARFVYNWALEQKNKAYVQDKKSLSCLTIKKQLPILKTELEWLREVNSQSLQQAIFNLDIAFTNFFRRVKQGDKDPGYPTFKQKHNRQSFQCPQHVSVDFANGLMTVPKIPKLKVEFSRSFDGKIKTVTISRTPSNKYFVSILVDNDVSLPVKPKIDSHKTIGIDLGLTHFAILSNGEKIANPRFNKKEAEKIALLNRRLHRKVKGSKNRNKQRVKLARAYEFIENCRNDFLHKVSSKLVSENQTICLEDLNVAGMKRNHCLAGAISDVSWSKFVGMLSYKSDWYGKNLIKIGRFDPSSKLCSNCGYYKSDLGLSDRSWLCPQCGTSHDRDINAAINIKTFALQKQNLINQVPMDSREVTPVETQPLLRRLALKQVGSAKQEPRSAKALESAIL